MLELNLRELERIIYYEEYIVIDPGDTPLKKGDLLSEEKYQQTVENYGHKFVAKMGGEAIRELQDVIRIYPSSPEARSLLEEVNIRRNRQ